MIKYMLKYKEILIFGIGLALIMSLIGTISFYKCTDNIGCLFYTTIPLLPGVFLNLESVTSIIVSLFFWFLLGSLIGFLIYKLKKTK